jgi:hypothetical protein
VTESPLGVTINNMHLSLCHGWVPKTSIVSLPQAANGRSALSISALLTAGIGRLLPN